MTQTIFIDTFGASPLLKILDFLVVNEDFDYSMVDIAKLSGVGYATLKLLWPRLEKNNIITQTRTIGNAKMYALNINNPVISSFKKFYWDITKKAVRQELELPAK